MQLSNLAYQCMQLRMRSGNVIAGLDGVDRQQLGIPSEEEYVAQYCRNRSFAGIPNWDFYLVFSYFRFAAILQGVLKRAIDGNASSKMAFEYGVLAPQLARQAAEVLE